MYSTLTILEAQLEDAKEKDSTLSASCAMVRIAFLVGNKSYTRKGQHVTWWHDIPTAFHDVDVVHDILEDLSFECEAPLKDATVATLQDLPRRMADRLSNTDSSLCLWLYSGHAVTFGGCLYLIPSDFMLDLPKLPLWILTASMSTSLTSYLLTPGQYCSPQFFNSFIIMQPSLNPKP